MVEKVVAGNPRCLYIAEEGINNLSRMKGRLAMAEESKSGYEAPSLTKLGTLAELTMGSSLNILGDAVLQASASIIHITI